MSQIENRRKEEGRSLVEFYADTSTAALPRDVLELLNPIRTALVRDAVHRQAIFRLLDLWPEAKVRVVHLRPIVVDDNENTGGMYTNKQREEMFEGGRFALTGGQTQVIILPNPEAPDEQAVVGFADCHGGDQYNKRLGTTLAFSRALKKLERRTKELTTL